MSIHYPENNLSSLVWYLHMGFLLFAALILGLDKQVYMNLHSGTFAMINGMYGMSEMMDIRHVRKPFYNGLLGFKIMSDIIALTMFVITQFWNFTGYEIFDGNLKSESKLILFFAIICYTIEGVYVASKIFYKWYKGSRTSIKDEVLDAIEIDSDDKDNDGTDNANKTNDDNLESILTHTIVDIDNVSNEESTANGKKKKKKKITK